MLPVNPSASYSAELPSQSYPPSFFSTVVASMCDLSFLWENEDDSRRSEIFSAIIKIRNSMVSTARITAIVYSSLCGSLVPISLTEPEHLGRDHRAPPDSSAVGAVAFMPMSPARQRAGRARGTWAGAGARAANTGASRGPDPRAPGWHEPQASCRGTSTAGWRGARRRGRSLVLSLASLRARRSRPARPPERRRPSSRVPQKCLHRAQRWGSWDRARGRGGRPRDRDGGRPDPTSQP